MSRAILVLHLYLCATFVFGAEISGVVTEVHDGDTITRANLQFTYRVRLVDIDAPELAQPRGKDSRTSLRELCLLKRATVETRGEDRFGRPLGHVTCVGVDANADQVRRGWAWVYVRYAPKNSPLYAIEREARLDRRGLWADDVPMPPWEWRENRRLEKNLGSPK